MPTLERTGFYISNVADCRRWRHRAAGRQLPASANSPSRPIPAPQIVSANVTDVLQSGRTLRGRSIWRVPTCVLSRSCSRRIRPYTFDEPVVDPSATPGGCRVRETSGVMFNPLRPSAQCRKPCILRLLPPASTRWSGSPTPKTSWLPATSSRNDGPPQHRRSKSLIRPMSCRPRGSFVRQGAQYITLAGRVAAAVFERAGTHPFVKHARRAQEFRDEHQLAVGRGLR